MTVWVLLLAIQFHSGNGYGIASKMQTHQECIDRGKFFEKDILEKLKTVKKVDWVCQSQFVPGV